MEQRDDMGRVLSAEQEAFFQKSVARNEIGQLLTMYHGSSYSFDAFDVNKIRASETDAPYNGFWFSDDPNTLPAWTRLKSRYEVYLDLQNPAPMELIWDLDKKLQDEIYENMGRTDGIWHPQSRSSCDELRYRLMDLGYDGIIHSCPPDIDKEQFEATGRAVVSTARGTRYLLEKNEDGYVELYYFDPTEPDNRGEFLTDYHDLEDYLGMQERVFVVFEPQQIKAVTNRQPTKEPNFLQNHKNEIAAEPDGKENGVIGNVRICDFKTKTGIPYQIRAQSYSDKAPYFYIKDCSHSGFAAPGFGSNDLDALLREVKSLFSDEPAVIDLLENDPRVRSTIEYFMPKPTLDQKLADAAKRAGTKHQEHMNTKEHDHIL